MLRFVEVRWVWVRLEMRKEVEKGNMEWREDVNKGGGEVGGGGGNIEQAVVSAFQVRQAVQQPQFRQIVCQCPRA